MGISNNSHHSLTERDGEGSAPLLQRERAELTNFRLLGVVKTDQVAIDFPHFRSG
jgi:hypothetical protein